MLSGLNWGIPNSNHPFSYHMDEWAQAQSIRSLFKYGTPNISGSSHGAIFQYFLSGIYLIPFIILHVINPFAIKSSLGNIDQQHKLFEILRLNTLLFGTGTLILISIIAKRYLKISPIFPVLFFAITPIFLALSNYFKYDIALVFWISFSLMCFFHYAENPSLKNFILAGFVSALSFATKLSGFPLFLVYIFLFFLFTPQWKEKRKWLITGMIVYMIVFLVAGIPDFFHSRIEYLQWLYSNLISGPKNDTNNYNLGFPYWIFLPFVEYPALFGRIFYSIFLVSIVFVVLHNTKKERLLLFSLGTFIFSLIPLKIGAVGNRALVLLPFFVLLSGIFIEQMRRIKTFPIKKIGVVLFSLSILVQTLESLSWISTRVAIDPRETSSLWVIKHIPAGTTIGIENVPIFQFIPDIALKEFYDKIYNSHAKTRYNFVAIEKNSPMLPHVIILNNVDVHIKYEIKSSKKDIMIRLSKNHYRKIARFTPDFSFYKYFNDDKLFFISAIIASPVSIEIYTNN